MVTSKVVADSLVDGAVVVQSAVQSVRKRTALRWNGRSVVALTEKSTVDQHSYNTKHSYCTLNLSALEKATTQNTLKYGTRPLLFSQVI